jgi:hypothetical protein
LSFLGRFDDYLPHSVDGVMIISLVVVVKFNVEGIKIPGLVSPCVCERILYYLSGQNLAANDAAQKIIKRHFQPIRSTVYRHRKQW